MPRLSLDSDGTLVGDPPELSPIDQIQIPQNIQVRQRRLTFRTLGSVVPSRHSTTTTTATTPPRRMDDFAPEWRNVIAGIIRSRAWSETQALQPAMNRLWELVWATATSAIAKGFDYVDCTPGFHLGRLECPGGKGLSETTAQLTVQWMYRRMERLRPGPASSTSSSSRSGASSVATTASLTHSQRSRAQKAICTPDMVGYATKRDPTENSSAPPLPDPSHREQHHNVDDDGVYRQHNRRKRRRRDQRTPCIGAIVAEFKRQNVLKALCQCLIYLATAYEQCGTSLALLVISGIGGAGRENIHFLRIVYNGSAFFVEMADGFVERHAASVTLDMLERDEQPLFEHLPNGWVNVLCDEEEPQTTTVEPNVAAINRVIDFLGYARDQVTSLPSLDYAALKNHLGSAGRRLGRAVAVRAVASSQSPEQAEESVDDEIVPVRDSDSDRSLVSFPTIHSTSIADMPLPLSALASSGDGPLPHLNQTIKVRNSDHPLPVLPIDPTPSSSDHDDDDDAAAQLSHVDKNLAFATMMARKDKDKLLARVYAELLGSTASVDKDADHARLREDPDDDGANGATPDGQAGGGAGRASADPGAGPGASGGSRGTTAATRDGGFSASSSSANRCCAGRDDADGLDHDDYQDHKDSESDADADADSDLDSDSDSDGGDTKSKTASPLQDQDRAFRGTTLYAAIKELAWPIAFVTAAEMDAAVAVAVGGAGVGVDVDGAKARGAISRSRRNSCSRLAGCSPRTDLRRGKAETDLGDSALDVDVDLSS